MNPDRLLDKPYMELPYADHTEFNKHPLRAAAALMVLDITGMKSCHP